MTLSPAQLAAQIGGEAFGDESVAITGVCSADDARAGAVTFAQTPKHLAQALASAASAIIASARVAPTTALPPSKALIAVKNPRAGFARAVRIFFPPPHFEPGVHPSAIVGEGVQLGASVHVGAGAIVKAGARIGARSAVDCGAVIGACASIGEDCVIHPRVTIYPGAVIGNRVIIHAGAVIGSDGFGYVTEAGAHLKIPQVGKVVIGDDVEIGANTTVDRAALGSTVIKRGTKIDNLVQIAHNTTIGEHCLIVAQVGIAGSTTLGNYVVLGGQVGIVDHKTLGDHVMVGAGSPVITDIPSKTVVWGFPAQAHRKAFRELSALRRLPQIIKDLTARGILGKETDGEA